MTTLIKICVEQTRINFPNFIDLIMSWPRPCTVFSPEAVSAVTMVSRIWLNHMLSLFYVPTCKSWTIEMRRLIWRDTFFFMYIFIYKIKLSRWLSKLTYTTLSTLSTHFNLKAFAKNSEVYMRTNLLKQRSYTVYMIWWFSEFNTSLLRKWLNGQKWSI